MESKIKDRNLNVLPIDHHYFLNPELAAFMNYLSMSYTANREYAYQEMIDALRKGKISKIKKMVRDYFCALDTIEYIEKETYAAYFSESRARYNKVRKLFCHTKKGKESDDLKYLGIECGAALNYEALEPLVSFGDDNEKYKNYMAEVKGLAKGLIKIGFIASIVSYFIRNAFRNSAFGHIFLSIALIISSGLTIAGLATLIYYLINTRTNHAGTLASIFFCKRDYSCTKPFVIAGYNLELSCNDYYWKHKKEIDKLDVGLNFRKRLRCNIVNFYKIKKTKEKRHHKGYIYDEFVKNLDEGNFITDYEYLGIKNGRLDEFPQGYRTDIEDECREESREERRRNTAEANRLAKAEEKKKAAEEKKAETKRKYYFPDDNEGSAGTKNDDPDRKVRRRKK